MSIKIIFFILWNLRERDLDIEPRLLFYYISFLQKVKRISWRLYDFCMNGYEFYV